MVEYETTVTVSCDVQDCAAEVSGKGKRYWDFYPLISGWGWRRVLSTSPHPSPGISWAVTLHFCPEHQVLAEHPERYTVRGKPASRADYVVRLKEALELAT